MSVLYQHCNECSEPIRSEQPYTHQPNVMHVSCYIERLLKRINDLESELGELKKAANVAGEEFSKKYAHLPAQ